jgi:hypothetical protein
MYFDHRTYFRLVYLSFFGRPKIGGLGPGRILFLLAFFALLPCVELFNALCFFLDDVFFPAHRRTAVESPIFIVGNPRSGTTLMHRLMAKDSKRFFSFYSWEIMFPAIVQKTLLSLLGKLDHRLGDILERTVRSLEDTWFKEFNKMHRVSLFLPEEDEKLLLHTLSSLDLIWFFPFTELHRYARFDEAVPEAQKRRIVGFYESCVRRQAYFRRGGALLSKNPLFSPKLRTLLAHFPEGRVIYMVRNPLDVIPSMLDMAQEIWKRTIGTRVPPAMEENIYEILKFFYNYPLKFLDGLEGTAYTIVKYDDLVREPERVIERVYARLGLDVTPEFREVLRVEAERILAYRSEHAYSLRERCITRQRIVTDLKHVFERFGFEARISAA